MPWTTTDLLASVRRSGFLPDACDLSSSDLLALADEELATILADLWKTAREEYRVKVEDLPITSGQRRYRIPRRALHRTVRAVTYVDAQGNERQASEVAASEAWRYAAPPGSAGDARYFFEHDEIVLLGAPTATEGALRVRYYERPPRLVEPSGAAAIAAPLTTTTLTLAVPVGGGVGTPGATVDIVRGDSPFETLYTDRLVVTFGGTTLTLNAATPIVVAAISTSTPPGARVDYVCPRDTTVYPPLPQEMHSVLVKATIRSALEALGDAVGAQRAAETLARRESAARDLAQPRNADRKPSIVARAGALRGRSGIRSWWGR